MTSHTYKFRGKRVDTGEWVYGDLVHKSATYMHGYDVNGDVFIVTVDPATIGQFTGLMDKNGVEVFEGDIVEFKGYRKNYIQAIEWHNIANHTNFALGIHNMLVLSNKTDNPELLEATK